MNQDSSLPPASSTVSYSTPPAPASVAPNQALMEAFARGYLADRRRDHRWRTAIRLLWLALAMAVAWALFSSKDNLTAPTGPHTALVDVRGEISANGEASADAINRALRDAFSHIGSKGVVLRINSPGGSPVQAGLVHDEIKRLRQLHGKPVLAVCEEMCASAAYYIAAAADEIYVDKASIVGSIGVLMDGFGFTGTMEKLGIERRLITAGANKGLLDPFSPQDERHRAYAQTMLDQIHQQFIKVVKDGRGKRLKETPDTFSGLYWSGESAIGQGLADHLGGLDVVARDVLKSEDVVDYTTRDNVAERLAKRFGAAVGEGAMQAFKSVAAVR